MISSCGARAVAVLVTASRRTHHSHSVTSDCRAVLIRISMIAGNVIFAVEKDEDAFYAMLSTPPCDVFVPDSRTTSGPNNARARMFSVVTLPCLSLIAVN